ncbi:MAG TPA: GNAT family N-acetyltransferase [Thermoleophilaceae bacterium]|nr:GNAT family N-acetyltransferase [Thermoleophilaceae bacterium]
MILRDGTEVVIRPIRPDDKAALERGFEQLSPASRYRRFLSPMNALTPRLLRYLTEVDHHSHEAIVAESAEKHEPIGVARYVRLSDDPAAAEVAVAVVDEWQGKGAGTELLARLEERALDEGIERFVATCLASNTEVLELLGEIGPIRTIGRANGTVDVEIALPAGQQPEAPLRALLRRAASGALAFKPPWSRSAA